MIDPAALLDSSRGNADFVQPQVPPPQSSRNRRPIYLLGAALLLLAAGWAARSYVTSRSQPKASEEKFNGRFVISSPLSLWATRAGKDVTITWDSRRPALFDARVGILTIKDASEQTEVSLTKAQLQTDRFTYDSKGDFLEISLEVFAPGGKSALESIMVAAPQLSTRSRSETPAIEVRRTEPVPRSAPPPPAIRAALSSAMPVRRFAAPTVRRTVPAPTSMIPDAPPATQTAAVDPARMRAPDFLPKAAQIQAPAAPAQEMRQALPARSAAPITPVQAPKALREIRPTLPFSVASMLKRPTQVQVRVFVDQYGRVTRAEPVIPPGGINQYLGASAANAAKLWTFQPARRGDTPLASELVLNFTFAPAK